MYMPMWPRSTLKKKRSPGLGGGLGLGCGCSGATGGAYGDEALSLPFGRLGRFEPFGFGDAGEFLALPFSISASAGGFGLFALASISS